MYNRIRSWSWPWHVVGALSQICCELGEKTLLVSDAPPTREGGRRQVFRSNVTRTWLRLP